MSAPQTGEFIAEAKEHLAEVCDQLLRLESSAAGAASDRIEQMMRAVHSVKGGAGFFGMRNIEQVAHRMETALESVLAGTVPHDSRTVDVLLVATDRMAALLDDIDRSDAADVSDVVGRLDGLVVADTQSGIQAESEPLPREIPEPVVAVVVASQALHTFPIAVDLSACQAAGIAPLAVVERAAQLGEISSGSIEAPQVDLAQSPPVGPVVWRATMASQFDAREFCRRFDVPLLSADANMHLPVAVKAEDVVTPVSEAAPASVAVGGAAAVDRSATIRIPIVLADQLMNLAGELVLVRNQARRFAELNEPLPAAVVQRFDAVTTEFQETVLQTRMQPIGNLFSKFPRLVRDLARQLGKQIELEVRGAEVELDKTILDAMSDPLTHLVRNGCDHGIEKPDVREAQGKPATGRIVLAARHAGDQICITVSDDGRGIDRAAVLRQAAKQAIRSPEELAQLGDRELLALILMPGFSTAAQVTDVSGRGVGMDVVKTNLARLGGSVEIDSVAGQGTTFTLRLPLTLAIIPGVLVTAADQRYVIAQKDLEEFVCVDAEQSRVRIEWTRDQEMVRLRGRLLPLVRLATVLNPGADRRQTAPPATVVEPSPLVFAVIKAGSRRYALAIDSVLSNEEIVVKPMHGRLRAWAMYSGATILGDGSVSLILGVDAIAREAGVRFNTDAERAPQVAASAVTERKTVLLLRQFGGEPVAVSAAVVRRIVMVFASQFERVGAGCYVTIDGTPTRVLSFDPRFDHDPIADRASEVSYILLPRGTADAVGYVVEDVLGTEHVGSEEIHPYPADPTAVGAAVIRNQITPIVELNRRLNAANLGGAVGVPLAGKTGPAHVLLVDDTQFFRDVVGRCLRDAGYLVTTAEHGAAALELLRHATFDLVVSDLEMPVLDGFALAAAVRQIATLSTLPMLALSTLTGDEVLAKAIGQGFDAYEVKLDQQSLLATVRDLLKGRHANAAGREACDAR